MNTVLLLSKMGWVSLFVFCAFSGAYANGEDIARVARNFDPGVVNQEARVIDRAVDTRIGPYGGAAAVYPQYSYPAYPAYPGYGPLYNPNAFPDSQEFQDTYERNAHPPRI